MTPTALQEQLKSADVTDYRGATVARRFSDPPAELPALLNGCGVYDLGFRARISLTGNDRVRWLNGMVTNNIRDLAVGQGIYAFLLNPQGHILGDIDAYNLGGSLTVETDRSQVEKILAVFDHYIIMDDVEVANWSDQLTAIGVGGPKAKETLRAAGLDFPSLHPMQFHAIKCDCDCGCPECTVVRDGATLRDSYEIWLAPKHVKQIWDALLKAGATPAGSEALEVRRILDGIPLYGVDIRERDLPQETEQTRALNFSKGCYIGQEIVERIRSRGAVHRTFTGFVCEGTAQTPLGTKIIAGGKEIGEITSAALISIAGVSRTVALGYIRREAGTPGREVTIGESKASVTQMPVDLATVSREPVEAQG
jgi:folate-binding protein YgfZ